MEITTDRLFAEIGVLHLEVALLKQQLAEKEQIIQNQVEALTRQAEMLGAADKAPEVVDVATKKKSD